MITILFKLHLSLLDTTRLIANDVGASWTNKCKKFIYFNKCYE